MGGWRATELREVRTQGSPLHTLILTGACGRLGDPVVQEAAGRLSVGQWAREASPHRHNHPWVPP